MLGTYRLRRYAKVLRSYVQRNVLVLLYHRVANIPTDPHLLCVTPGNFSQQMEVLRRTWNPISLRELSSGLKNKRLPRRAVLVTFDDGYADNLHNAKPILERFEIPAVVFVIGGWVGVERQFWWDELEKILLQPGSLPEELKFRINGAETRCTLGRSAGVYSEGDYRRHADWRFGRKVPTERHALYVDLYEVIRPLASDQQDEMLETLRVWSGYKASAPKSNLPMTARELRELRQENLIEVGAHTISHPVLSTLPLDSQRHEISESRKLLQEIADQPITGFAYPYGGDGDYTRETVDIVRKAGFESAFLVGSGLVRRESEAFRLSRNWVGNWNGEQFAGRLQRWFLDD
jgi:peptidoglycan/xylan/chitin deacetylase (PgdA/CDA1 family)